MKIDMHCHVREGSIDSKVPIEEFIKKLQSKGIGGMLVTDHDTYNGYRHWKNTIKGRIIRNASAEMHDRVNRSQT